jgi:hypothetical protein
LHNMKVIKGPAPENLYTLIVTGDELGIITGALDTQFNEWRDTCVAALRDQLYKEATGQ